MKFSATRRLLTLLRINFASESTLIEIALSQLDQSIEQQIIRRLDIYEFPSKKAKEIKKKLQSFNYITSSLHELYQSHEALRMLIQECGVPFKELSIGKLVQFGSYQNEPILWRVLHVAEDGEVFLISKKIVSFKAFNGSTDQQRFGIGQWKNSTLRIWLNSEKKRLSYGTDAPNKEHVWNEINPYSKEKGFLSEGNFSQTERMFIRFLGEGDRVRLLREKELREWMVYRGWEVTVRPTKKAIEQCTFKSKKLSPEASWGYTLLDDHAQSEFLVQMVSSKGEKRYCYAYDGTLGIRPLLCLKSSVQLNGSGTLEQPLVPFEA